MAEKIAINLSEGQLFPTASVSNGGWKEAAILGLSSLTTPPALANERLPSQGSLEMAYPGSVD